MTEFETRLKGMLVDHADSLEIERPPLSELSMGEARSDRRSGPGRRASVALAAASVVLVGGVAALIAISLQDDGSVGAPSIDRAVGSDDAANDLSTPSTGRFRSDVTVEASSEVTTPDGDPGIEFEARLVVDGSGVESVEIRFTSDLPAGAEVWGVLINGRLTTRSNHIPGSVLGVNLSRFVGDGAPVRVAVVAETSDREVVAESEEAILRGDQWSPGAADEFQAGLTTETVLADGTHTDEDGVVEWRIVLRTDSTRAADHGFCLDSRPVGGTYCTAGTDGRLAAAQESMGPDNISRAVIQVPPDSTAVEVRWDGGSSGKIEAQRPFSDSNIGFAVVELPIDTAVGEGGSGYEILAYTSDGRRVGSVTRPPLPSPAQE